MIARFLVTGKDEKKVENQEKSEVEPPLILIELLFIHRAFRLLFSCLNSAPRLPRAHYFLAPIHLHHHAARPSPPLGKG